MFPPLGGGDGQRIREWRAWFACNPETAFAETATAAFVAETLESFGVRVHRGIGGTGVVGCLDNGSNAKRRAIGLRAEMDAVAMSGVPGGAVHACGHDGHMAMLLGAACELARTRTFDGTVYFVFQPAEENASGARAMIADGLFAHFPMDAIFALHNRPGLMEGRFGVRAGAVMTSCDLFHVLVRGRSAHAALPHQGRDAIVAAAAMVTALQTMVSRSVSPLEFLVASITHFDGGSAWNVLPETAAFEGTIRTYRAEVRDEAEENLRRIVTGVAAAMGVAVELSFERRCPATINFEQECELAAMTARTVAGLEGLDQTLSPGCGSDDFAFMLDRIPGAYLWIGNGKDSVGLHDPTYVFNDSILEQGIGFWSALVERALRPL